MSTVCPLSMRIWGRYKVLLLCVCIPGGTGHPSASWAPSPRGDLGLFGLRQSSFCSPVLKGCVSLEGNSKSKRAVAGASPSVFLQLWNWLHCAF